MEKINVIDLDTNTVIQTTRSELLSAHSSNLFDHTFYILFQTRWGLAAFSVCTVVFLLAVAGTCKSAGGVAVTSAATKRVKWGSVLKAY